VGVGGAVLLEQGEVVGAGVAVQCPPLLRRPGEPELIGLPVHGQQVLGQLGHHADRDAAATEMRPGAPLRAHRAGEDQRAVLVGLGPGIRSARPDR
jgi:hypothetical protein